MFQSETINRLKAQLNLTDKQLVVICIGFVALASIIGFTRCSRSRAVRASAGVTCPQGRCPQANQVAMACPPGGCIRANPVALNQTPANGSRFISGGQYICSRCQHCSLPVFDSSGTPRCPICGGVMKVNQIGESPQGPSSPAR